MGEMAFEGPSNDLTGMSDPIEVNTFVPKQRIPQSFFLCSVCLVWLNMAGFSPEIAPRVVSWCTNQTNVCFWNESSPFSNASYRNICYHFCVCYLRPTQHIHIMPSWSYCWRKNFALFLRSAHHIGINVWISKGWKIWKFLINLTSCPPG